MIAVPTRSEQCRESSRFVLPPAFYETDAVQRLLDASDNSSLSTPDLLTKVRDASCDIMPHCDWKGVPLDELIGQRSANCTTLALLGYGLLCAVEGRDLYPIITREKSRTGLLVLDEEGATYPLTFVMVSSAIKTPRWVTSMANYHAENRDSRALTSITDCSEFSTVAYEGHVDGHAVGEFVEDAIYSIGGDEVVLAEQAIRLQYRSERQGASRTESRMQLPAHLEERLFTSL